MDIKILLFSLLISLSALGTEYKWNDNGISRPLFIKSSSQKNMGKSAQELSPIFTDGPDQTGIERRLAGGIVVIFKSEKTESEVLNVANEIGLSVVSKIPARGNKTWLISSTPDISVFELCEKLSKMSDVAEAKPNWQIKVSPK